MTVPSDRVATDMVDLLDIEELDTNLYRGYNEQAAAERPALFGGQVAAQALMAAARTVGEPRLPHSLHGYFLRPGSPAHPVILQVARDRDGRSFSARHVVALQGGEVIFSMSASFHHGEEGPEFSVERQPLTNAPEDLAERRDQFRFEHMLRIRPFPPARPYGDDEFPVPASMWARVPGPLPDDPVIHACALAYLSDVGSGFADGAVPDVPPGGPSIDHALWFHHPIRLDDWVLLETWSVKAIGARGLYAGSIRDREGRLGAMLSQEMLFRRRSTR